MDNKYNFLVYDSPVFVSIRDMVQYSYNKYKKNFAYMYKTPDNILKTVTYEMVYNDVKSLTSYLTSLGLKGKKIAIMGKNSYYWSLSYLTITSGVGIVVPVDRDLNEEQLDFVLKDSEASCLIYSSEESKKIVNKIDGVIYLCADDLDSFLKEGEALRDSGDTSFEDYTCNPFSLGILLYTSGTTGASKGVKLSQYNICSNVTAVKKLIAIYENDVFLSILPLHHTYECMAGFLSTFCSGSCVCYNDSVRNLMTDFQLYRPTVVIGVPLLFEKIYNMVIKKYSNIKFGKSVLYIQKTLASIMDNPEAKRKIFKTVNGAFGGRFQRILCGASKLKPEVFKGYESFGFRVYVGYGLTETSPVITVHSDSYRCDDDVGMPMPGIEVAIDEPNENGVGELITRGPNVMLGYYKNEEATNSVIKDGWFHTGDLAKIKDNGAVQIMGRVKSMIVLENGKKVFPEELEFYLGKNEFVKESFVFSTIDDGKIVITASIYPNREELQKQHKLKQNQNVEYDDFEKQTINDIVKSVNEQFPQYKTIKKIIIRKEDFEKTTTAKIKRNSLENMKEE